MTLFGLEIFIAKWAGHKLAAMAAKKAAVAALAHSSPQAVGHIAMQYATTVNSAAVATGSVGGYVTTVGHGILTAEGIAMAVAKKKEQMQADQTRAAQQAGIPEDAVAVLMLLEDDSAGKTSLHYKFVLFINYGRH
jgi:hypothetical protein